MFWPRLQWGRCDATRTALRQEAAFDFRTSVWQQPYPAIKVTPVSEEFIKTTSWDHDLAYKIAHRAINTRVTLKKLKFITPDTWPLCRQYPETINHLFMNCAIIKPTIQYIEDIVSTIYPHPFDSHMTLECVYPPEVNKCARCVVRQCVLMVHVAIWTHHNKVIFVKNYVSENAIKSIFVQN